MHKETKIWAVYQNIQKEAQIHVQPGEPIDYGKARLTHDRWEKRALSWDLEKVRHGGKRLSPSTDQLDGKRSDWYNRINSGTNQRDYNWKEPGDVQHVCQAEVQHIKKFHLPSEISCGPLTKSLYFTILQLIFKKIQNFREKKWAENSLKVGDILEQLE